MKVVVIKGLVLAASLVLFCASAWDGPGGSMSARAARASVQGEEVVVGARGSRAKALFDARCARCHGEDGRGKTKLGEMLAPPDFTDEDWQKRASDARMRDSIRDGVGEMPAFSRKLSRRDITTLVSYVRGFSKHGR